MSGRLATVRAPTPDPPGGLLSPGDVGERLAVSRSMVYKLLRTGELPALYVGRLPRIDPADHTAYIDRLRSRREARGL